MTGWLAGVLTPADLHVGSSVPHHHNALVAELLGQAGERGGGGEGATGARIHRVHTRSRGQRLKEETRAKRERRWRVGRAW